jgi:hypothetical protein
MDMVKEPRYEDYHHEYIHGNRYSYMGERAPLRP